MYRKYQIGGGLLLLILSASVQAGPLINVISDHLQLTSYARLVDNSGTSQFWEESYTGKVLSGYRTVNAYADQIYEERYWSCCDDPVYEEHAVFTHADLSLESYGFDLYEESGKYFLGNDQDTPPTTYYTSVEVGAMASVDWKFAVSGGDVELRYYAADELMRMTPDYPAGREPSFSGITIFDETDSVEILNVAGWVFGRTNLLDGHTYRLHAVARDDRPPANHSNEVDVHTGLYFTGAEFVDVPEPSGFLLLGFGLVSLIAGRRLGRRGLDKLSARFFHQGGKLAAALPENDA